MQDQSRAPVVELQRAGQGAAGPIDLRRWKWVGGSCSKGTWTSELAIPRRLCEGATATLLMWSASLFAV